MPPAEWPKVFCPVIGQFPLDGKAGVQLFHGKTDVGVALVIFQQDIIVGLMALDEGVFQHQGLELRPGHDGVEVVDLGDHGAGLFVVVRGVVEILAHPVFQGLGLAHIDHGVLGVLHDIYARL